MKRLFKKLLILFLGGFAATLLIYWYTGSIWITSLFTMSCVRC